MRSAANGFCVFNNVSIAAKYAKQKYGLKRYHHKFIIATLSEIHFIVTLCINAPLLYIYVRVLIVDWDVHHGQGVQYCFEDDPR